MRRLRVDQAASRRLGSDEDEQDEDRDERENGQGACAATPRDVVVGAWGGPTEPGGASEISGRVRRHRRLSSLERLHIPAGGRAAMAFE